MRSAGATSLGKLSEATQLVQPEFSPTARGGGAAPVSSGADDTCAPAGAARRRVVCAVPPEAQHERVAASRASPRPLACPVRLDLGLREPQLHGEAPCAKLP